MLGLAFPAKHIDPEPTNGGGFAFEKLFGDDDFIASGVITFPVGGKKPKKSTKDNTYVPTSLNSRLYCFINVICNRCSLYIAVLSR